MTWAWGTWDLLCLSNKVERYGIMSRTVNKKQLSISELQQLRQESFKELDEHFKQSVTAGIYELETFNLDALKAIKRLCVAGPPMSGKSIISDRAKEWGKRVVHTDDYRDAGIPYVDAAYAILNDVVHLEEYVLAGVNVPRILRAGLKPDLVIWMDIDRGMTDKQRPFAKGLIKIFNEWKSSNKSIQVITLI